MKSLGVFVLLASFAFVPGQVFAESKSERQQARFQSAVSRMVERSRPPAAQPRGPSMPAVQRQMSQPQQQRASNPNPFGRSARTFNPDASQPLRQRAYNQPQFDRGAGRSPVINTASAEQPIQAPRVSTPRMGRNDSDRADRLRAWVDRNRADGNRGNRVAVAPGANVEGPSGAVTTPNVDQTEGRGNGGGDRRGGGDRNWDGNRGGGNPHGEADHRHGGNRHGSWRERHRDWHERHRNDPNFDRNHRRWHNRDWWRRNYTRFTLFGGGYYYWNSGYWYPAYGYHPSYSTYSYDAPLYGYNGLPPGQVISLVQTQLQQRGYYNAAVDGTFGPRTEQALLNYQADHGLPMTGEIDEETLSSLGYQ